MTLYISNNNNIVKKKKKASLQHSFSNRTHHVSPFLSHLPHLTTNHKKSKNHDKESRIMDHSPSSSHSNFNTLLRFIKNQQRIFFIRSWKTKKDGTVPSAKGKTSFSSFTSSSIPRFIIIIIIILTISNIKLSFSLSSYLKTNKQTCYSFEFVCTPRWETAPCSVRCTGC